MRRRTAVSSLPRHLYSHISARVVTHELDDAAGDSENEMLAEPIRHRRGRGGLVECRRAHRPDGVIKQPSDIDHIWVADGGDGDAVLVKVRSAFGALRADNEMRRWEFAFEGDESLITHNHPDVGVLRLHAIAQKHTRCAVRDKEHLSSRPPVLSLPPGLRGGESRRSFPVLLR